MNTPMAARAGSAVAWQAIQLLGVKVIFLARTMVLARLLVPDDVGLLAVSLIALDFLTSVTNLGIGPALVQRRDLDERHYDAAWTIGVVRALGIAALVILAAPAIASLLNEPRATNIIRVMAFKPLLVALASTKLLAVTRELDFRRLALIITPDAVVNTVVSITLARTLGVWALVAGSLAGQGAHLVTSYWLAPHRPRLLFDGAAVRPLIQFGRWMFLTSIVSLLGRSLLQVVITQRLGAAELGLYFLAAKLAFIPNEISSEVIGAVAFPLYARLQSDVHKAANAFRSISVGLAALLFPICSLMLALMPALVDTVLGSRWKGATLLIQLLTLVNVFGLLGDIAAPAFKGLGQPHRLSVVAAVQSIVLIAMIWGLTDQLGVLNAGYAWLTAVGASQLLSAYFLRQVMPRPFARLGTPLLVIAVVCSIGSLSAWLIVNAWPGLPGLVTAAIMGTAVMGVLLWMADRRFEVGLASSLRLAFPQLSLVLGPSSS